MKKLLALLLALMMLAGVFAGCGETNVDPEGGDPTVGGDTDADPTGGDTQTPPVNDEEPHYREFDNPYHEALVVYAEAMLARKQYIQYDDTKLITGSETPTTYRWQRGVMTAENYNKQMTGYTNCAAFTWNVYYDALGYDIGDWHTRGLYENHPDRLVFLHETTHNESDEEKQRIEEEFVSLLEPGDIITVHHAGSYYGHAMLYVGEGKIIHSSSPGGGNYDYVGKRDNVEPTGSIAYLELSRVFDPSYYSCFWKDDRFMINRPLLDYTGEIPEATKNRIKNLQNVVVSLCATRTIGQTINPGEEITFSFEMRNGNNWSMPLEVKSAVPAHTTLVKAEGAAVDGNDLAWNVTVPKGDTVTVEYTVKVDDDSSLMGSYIFSEGSVGGVPVTCQKIYIEKTLTSDEQAKMTAAINDNATSDLTGIELINKIYTDALGKTVSFTSEKELIRDVFKAYKGVSPTHLSLNKESKFFDMVVPTMYGGYYVAVAEDAFEGVRTRGPRGVQLMAGDIIVLSNNRDASDTHAYMYTGANTVMDLDGSYPEIKDVMVTNDILLSLLGYYSFVIVRPAMAF